MASVLSIPGVQMPDQMILNCCTTGNLAVLKQCAALLPRLVHYTFDDGQTCLLAACRSGHLEIVKYLIDECGADIEQVGVVEFESEQVEGVPPLWCASASGHLSIVKALVDRGADVNRTTITNSTALRAACFDGHENIVRYLVEHGANVEIPNRHGHTCLMISCFRRQDKIVEFLLEKKARVNRRSAKGNTALHDCAESGNLRGLQLLLKHGAIIRPDEFGQSPIMSAANAAFRKVVDHLALISEDITPIPFTMEEKIAAYELLGASLFDRHSLIQDAISAWVHSLRLRRASGLHPKRFSQPEAFCSSCGATLHTLPSFPDNAVDTNWSLVSLAAREAIFINERMTIKSKRPPNQHDHKYVLNNSLDCPHLNAIASKLQSIHSELYQCYLEELELCDLPIARLAKWNEMAYGSEFSESDDTCHPAAHRMTTPADPVRQRGVPCWERPRFRKWIPDRQPTASRHPVSPPNTRTKPVEFCQSCRKRIIRFSSTPRWFGSLCSHCAFLDGPTSSKSIAPISDQTTPQSSTICDCQRLAPEDHPLVRRLRQFGEEAFGQVREFANEEDLNNLMRNAHELRLQPLLIRLRILGPDHLDTIYFIRYRGAIYADTDNFHRCLTLWRYALELQRLFLEPLCHVTQSAFASFAELFQFVLSNSYTGLSSVDLDPSLIIDCFQLAVDSVERGMDYSFYHWYRRYPWSYSNADKEASNLMRHVTLCLHFIAMVLRHYLPDFDVAAAASDPTLSPLSEQAFQILRQMQESLTPTLREQFFKQIYRLIRLDPRVHKGCNLIHLACAHETSSVGRFVICPFPDPAVLRVLCSLGADPNCPDVSKQRPLLSVLSHPRLETSQKVALVKLLLEHGAHLDATDVDGVSALDPCFSHILSYAGVRPMEHVTLQCLAARAARQLDLNRRFCPVHLPDSLWSFIEMH